MTGENREPSAGPMDPNKLHNALSEDWLRSIGFKWHEMERQNAKHWLLWLGHALGDGGMATFEDIGVELASGAYRGPDRPPAWFCWLRSDCSHRYSRFIHVRHLVTRLDLVRLIEGVIGAEFDPRNARYGSLVTPEQAERDRREEERLDRRLLRSSHPWSCTERDESRGRPLRDHMDAAIKAGLAK